MGITLVFKDRWTPTGHLNSKNDYHILEGKRKLLLTLPVSCVVNRIVRNAENYHRSVFGKPIQGKS